MKRAYRFCLIFYPRAYRAQFAEEMTHVFDQASDDHRAEGWTAYFRFASSEMAGLITAAAWAWLAPGRAAQAAAAKYSNLPREVTEAQQRVDENVAAMVHAIAHHQFERARQFSYQERIARQNLRVVRDKYNDELGLSC